MNFNPALLPVKRRRGRPPRSEAMFKQPFDPNNPAASQNQGAVPSYAPNDPNRLTGTMRYESFMALQQLQQQQQQEQAAQQQAMQQQMQRDPNLPPGMQDDQKFDPAQGGLPPPVPLPDDGTNNQGQPPAPTPFVGGTQDPAKLAEMEAEQRKDILRQETVLAGKRRFKEIRAAIGQDLFNMKNPNLNFIQKLNAIINTQTTVLQNRKLVFPFREVFDPATAVQNAENGGVKDSQVQLSMRRMKRRIEKEVTKRENQYHRMQIDLKIKAMQSQIKMQAAQMDKLQNQFDKVLAQMLKVLLGNEINMANPSEDQDKDPAQETNVIPENQAAVANNEGEQDNQQIDQPDSNNPQ